MHVIDDNIALGLNVCVLDRLRNHNVVLGVICVISIMISRNHVNPVRPNMTKYLLEEEALAHAALGEKQDGCSQPV